MKHLIFPVAFLTLLAHTVNAQTDAGQVELPLATYNRLVETARGLETALPANFALGNAGVNITVESEKRDTAEVEIELNVNVLTDDWALIPVLPAGTAIQNATVDGAPIQLMAVPGSLAWATRQQGSHTMKLYLRLDAMRSESGRLLAVPTPRAASIQLTAALPGQDLDIAVIPATGTTTRESSGVTYLNAAVPTTTGMQLSWRPPTASDFALSRARYTGELIGDAVLWTSDLTVELLGGDPLTLPLLPSSMTLRSLRVDGRDATILLEGDHFATLIRGRGRHTVTAGFEVPVERRDGPPRIDLEVPPVPVSRFELTLPGNKDVTVTPTSSIASQKFGETTLATAHIPLTSKVSFSWTEAIPEEVLTEVRLNAAIYHAAHAQEGVLYVKALADLEVSRGETNVLRLDVPADVQIDAVSASGSVVDWRLGPKPAAPEDSTPGSVTRELAIFLDRQLQGRLVVEVDYDRTIQPDDSTDELTVPLLRSRDAQRQRGMVALLAGRNLALQPVVDDGATRVGENQLPAFVRDRLELPVAHTFKYVETPRIGVEATAPERLEGRFDASVDTLVSLGEVAIKAAASIEIDVKSGQMMELELSLPARDDINLLSLTGPSVRQHRIESGAADSQQLLVEFTQEMEGRFRLEAVYERLLDEGEVDIETPLLTVPAADVDQGRIAIEALAAIEIKPSATPGLTSLDANEIPQRLVLLTTHPILHAYKYVATSASSRGQEGGPRLDLTVTRHETVDVHQAAIDRAEYRTLYTHDGLSVTAARFRIRNSRRQFLRLKLPADSEIWSAFVDGRPEKPARAVAENGQEQHLIRIIHSTHGFDVELIYQTPARALRGLGAVSGVLPRPEILVTHTRWDVYLPQGIGYGQPQGNMELITDREPVAAEDLSGILQASSDQLVKPLRPVIPTVGVHFAFEKLYANQGASEARFEIPYASGFGRNLGRLLSLVGVALFWIGLAFAVRGDRRLGTGLTLVGLVLLAVIIGHYQLGAGPALWSSFLVLLGLCAYQARAWRSGKTQP